MSSADVKTDPTDGRWFDHFSSPAQQAHAARLGMWIFLGTEVLLFGGLFVAYAVYRSLFSVEFALASERLHKGLGTLETVILLTSSLSVALSLQLILQRRRMAAVVAVVITVCFGLAFLGIHSYEYYGDWREGALPGTYYRLQSLPYAGANMFYTLYFLMTGLHSLHVIAGCAVLSWCAWRIRRETITPAYMTPLDSGALYWHLVDLIWIFLYPLFYLVKEAT